MMKKQRGFATEIFAAILAVTWISATVSSLVVTSVVESQPSCATVVVPAADPAPQPSVDVSAPANKG